MNQLHQQLVKRREYLVQLRKEIARYYCINKDGDTHGEYVSKGNMDLACKLAQKDYIQKLNCIVNDELKDIEKYLLRHREHALESVFTNLNAYRQNALVKVPMENISEELLDTLKTVHINKAYWDGQLEGYDKGKCELFLGLFRFCNFRWSR